MSKLAETSTRAPVQRGASNAISMVREITSAMLDRYLLKNGLALSQLSLPAISDGLRARYAQGQLLGAQSLAGRIIGTVTRNTLESVTQEPPQEEEKAKPGKISWI